MVPSLLLAAALHLAGAQQLALPTCWLHHGECLDLNQPPLDITAKTKPLNNENVVKVEVGC